MRIGPPPRDPPARLLAARTLAALTARDRSSELEDAMTHRVRALRDQVGRGTYRVDPSRLAVSVYEAIAAGGL